jgi:hypothetical protein
MKFSSEQHLAMAKLLRDMAKSLVEPTRGQAIRRSNAHLACAVLAAKDRGGLSTSGFDFEALSPDWSIIESQIARLEPLHETPLQIAPAAHTGTVKPQLQEDRQIQVRQLIKLAIESPTIQGLAEFLDFTTRFRRLAVWNARMAYIQRPGARVIASEFEWRSIGRHVLPDAVPIIILWPFSPIRFVYELEDTGPPIDREQINDPFAVKGEFRPRVLSTLTSSLKQQRHFKVKIESRRHGFSYAGSAAAQGVLPIAQLSGLLGNDGVIGTFVRENVVSNSQCDKDGIPRFRVTVNDRLEPKERLVTIAHDLGHIFCGHLGACASRSGKDEESGWPDRRHVSRHEKEVEAEAVAHLVASRAGLVTGSAAYLKTHAQRADMKKVDVELIVRAAARIERLARIHYGSMAFHE